MVYRIAEGALTLPSEWQDQSINVLMVPGAAPGANLVISRDRLPLGVSFAEHVIQQRQAFAAQLDGCETVVDSAGEIDGRTAHFLEMNWRSEGKPIRQVMALVEGQGGALLTFAGSIPGGPDEETRRMLVAAITSFTFAA